MPIALYTAITDAIVAVMASLSRRVVSYGTWSFIDKLARRLLKYDTMRRRALRG